VVAKWRPAAAGPFLGAGARGAAPAGAGPRAGRRAGPGPPPPGARPSRVLVGRPFAGGRRPPGASGPGRGGGVSRGGPFWGGRRAYRYSTAGRAAGAPDKGGRNDPVMGENNPPAALPFLAMLINGGLREDSCASSGRAQPLSTLLSLPRSLVRGHALQWRAVRTSWMSCYQKGFSGPCDSPFHCEPVLVNGWLIEYLDGCAGLAQPWWVSEPLAPLFHSGLCS
jgi:hypothetical protein